MNIALRLQEKGRLEGHKEARQQAYQQQLATALYLLKNGIGLELVIKSTGISHEALSSLPK
ncbi:hypothetical protein [Providencia rettgeri]|uniref:hypothetical protein n=1 Tax=Providencia rettgeri TaxID=587 RepID=UPI0034E07D6B